MSIRKIEIDELPEDMQMKWTYRVLRDAQRDSGREGYLAEEVKRMLNTITLPSVRFSLTQTYSNLFKLEKRENMIVSKYASPNTPHKKYRGRLIFSVAKKDV